MYSGFAAKAKKSETLAWVISMTRSQRSSAGPMK